MAVSHTDEMRENRDEQIGVMQDGVKLRKVIMLETRAPICVILLEDRAYLCGLFSSACCGLYKTCLCL